MVSLEDLYNRLWSNHFILCKSTINFLVYVENIQNHFLNVISKYLGFCGLGIYILLKVILKI